MTYGYLPHDARLSARRGKMGQEDERVQLQHAYGVVPCGMHACEGASCGTGTSMQVAATPQEQGLH